MDVHVALEMLGAPVLFVAPFVLGFSSLAGGISIAIGILLLGLATTALEESTPSGVPLRAHAGFDYLLDAVTIAAGLVVAFTGEPVASLFLVGFGLVHMALTASTRFSRPLGA